MIMVGLGGILVEILKDVAFRICPITEADAHAMLGELKGGALIDGVRGQAPVDKAALVDVMLRIGGADGLLMSLAGEIAEADINPVIVAESAPVAAVARFIIHAGAAAGPDESAAAADRDAVGPPTSLDTVRPRFA